MRPSIDTPIVALGLSGLLGLLVALVTGPVAGVATAVLVAVFAARPPLRARPIPVRVDTEPKLTRHRVR